MPTNLPPEAVKAEERYREAQTSAERIARLEEFISLIPKHKGTDRLRADLRRKLSQLKAAAQSGKGASRQASVYNIDREGAGQVVLVGPPNVGKSALVNALTNAAPESAPFPFTTWGPTPGMMRAHDVQIQLIDTPPLNKEYVDPHMMDLVRRVDLLLLVVDLQGFPIEELEEMLALLETQRILPDWLRENNDFPHHVFFKPCLIIANKNDDESSDEDFAVLCELLEDVGPLIPVSAATGRNLDRLRQAVFDKLKIMRVYAKPPGKEPDFSAPFVLKQGGTVEEFAAKVHNDFVENLKSARVWGSAAHDGLMVGRDHVLQDGDVVELRT